MNKIAILLILTVGILTSCSSNSNDGGGSTVVFDREGILNNLVNNIVLPAYDDFSTKITALKLAESSFVENPSVASLQDLQTALFEAQKVWQHVAMFEFGTAEELNYRAFMNTYPVDFETEASANDSEEDNSNLIDNINEVFKSEDLEDRVLLIENIDFTLTSRADEQGFPVVDYLVNGIENSNAEIVTKYIDEENYKKYLTKVIDRMVSLTNSVTGFWESNANSVIANNGSSSGASLSKLLNDYLNYFEQGFREAKIATPSGARETGEDINSVESFYSSQNSKILFEEAYTAVQNFYTGTAYNSSDNGLSIEDALISLNATVWDADNREQVSIIDFATEQYEKIDATVIELDDDFVTQVETDNSKMTETFIELQKYVVLTKTNIFQVLGVQVDFVDGDGD